MLGKIFRITELDGRTRPDGLRSFFVAGAMMLLAATITTPTYGQAQTMSSSEISQTEAADRVAIRNLIDGYSHNADRRDATAQAALFTEDAVLEVFMGDPVKGAPIQVKRAPAQALRGRAAMAAAFSESLSKFDTTFHFNGQSTITLNGDSATAETYCLAHHVWVDEGQRKLMVMAIRYYDTFVRSNGTWLISGRTLMIDWTDTRPSQP